jgi:hypothetical protein
LRSRAIMGRVCDFPFGVPALPPQLTQVALLFDEPRTKASVLPEKTYRIVESVAGFAAGQRISPELTPRSWLYYCHTALK